MYSLFERTEEGYEFEIRELRQESKEMVFKYFVDDYDIRRVDFENADELFEEYYNQLEYDYNDYYFQKFCRAKWLKTVNCAGCRGNIKCEFEFYKFLVFYHLLQCVNNTPWNPHK